jgi:DnaJ-domain-containing protein 1
MGKSARMGAERLRFVAPMLSPELLDAACCIAAADGKVTTQERKLLNALAARLSLSEISVEASLRRALTDPTFRDQQFRLALGDPRATLRALLIVAGADGRISPEERETLNFFAVRLGLDHRAVNSILSELKGQVRAHRRLRGENPDTGAPNP